MERNRIKKNSGQAMITSVVFFLFISLTTIAGLVSPTVRDYTVSRLDLDSKKVYYLTESGSEDAVYRIKTNKTINPNEVITLGSNTVTTNVTTVGDTKEVESLGNILNFQRKVNVILGTGTGASFNYGVQVGQGGISLSNSATVNGNIYANGPVTGSGTATVTGTAISASSPPLSVDQSNEVTMPPEGNVVFGNADLTQDIAQGFKLAVSNPLNKMEFYIKKTGSPASATVKIVNDASGLPGTTVIATGTLVNTLVGSTYSWVSVPFGTNPVLSVDTQYWAIIDVPSTSPSSYTIGANGIFEVTYLYGPGKIGRSGVIWNATTPNPGMNYFFKIYLGGIIGLINGPLSVGTISGTAQANTVNNTNATGLIYCQTGTGNNKPCTYQADPQYVDFAISDATLTQWKADAEAGGTISGDYSLSGGSATLGPKKITGNLTVRNGAVLTVSGTLWVVGNINVSNEYTQIRLSSSYGSNDGVIINDGTIAIANGSNILGSGSSDSYLMLATTSYSTNAISISGSAGAAVLYAPDGTLNIANSATLKEATAYKVMVSGSSSISYDTGLINMNFSSGPSGGWNITDWEETQ